MVDMETFINIIKSEFPEDRLTYQRGIATFHPESADEAARLFKYAGQERQPLFISGFGNNIDPVGKWFEKVIVMRTDRLNSFTRVVPEDFYIVVGSGFPLREINSVLDEHGLYLPHSALPYVGSVGGAVAVGLSAKLDKHAFPISRHLIKAEIATPQGEVIKPGSVCFKSVSGFDIVKIFSPSWGLLGLLASVTFRVLPVAARGEYEILKMSAIQFGDFWKRYQNPGDNVSVQYSIKIKRKFDPENILPLIDSVA